MSTTRRSPAPPQARAGLDGFFGACDAVLVPAAPGEAPAGLGNTGNPVFNRMWTCSACPAWPCRRGGARTACRPASSWSGGSRDDARLMGCAAFLERALAEAA